MISRSGIRVHLACCFLALLSAVACGGGGSGSSSSDLGQLSAVPTPTATPKPFEILSSTELAGSLTSVTSSPAVAISAHDSGLAVFADMGSWANGETRGLFGSHFNGSAWERPVVITGPETFQAGSGRQTEVAVNDADQAAVVFTAVDSTSGISVSRVGLAYFERGAWRYTKILDGDLVSRGTLPGLEPRSGVLGIDPSGTAYAAFAYGNPGSEHPQVVQFDRGGIKSTTQFPNESPGDLYLAVNSIGHVLFLNISFGVANVGSRVFDGSNWSDPQSLAPLNDTTRIASLAFYDSGEADLVTRALNHIEHEHFDGTSWRYVQMIWNSGSLPGSDASAASNGHILVSWPQPPFDRVETKAAFYDGTKWAAPVTVGPGGFPSWLQVLPDGAGRFVILDLYSYVAWYLDGGSPGSLHGPFSIEAPRGSLVPSVAMSPSGKMLLLSDWAQNNNMQALVVHFSP